MTKLLTDKPINEFPNRQGIDAGDFISSADMNACLDAMGERTNYLYTMGIYPHNTAFAYPIGAFCQVSGVVYRAAVANTGKPPVSNPSIWTACPMTAAEISAALNFVTALNGKQDADNTLTALANLATSADKMIYATGADQFALTPLTAFIRTLLDDGDADAARVTLGAAPLVSPALTGTPTAPTAAAGTNTKQIATTEFVSAEIAADRPFEATLANIKMDGTQAVGTLNTVARGDHVHPTDTSRAPLASPSFTGTPAAPTPATGTRSTQLATTAFVGAESQIAAPTGSVYTFAGATVPTGWLKCNGALLSRTTYAALFAVIGTTYGAGDGSTTFALPDLRGEFVRGFDDARGVDSGRALGSNQGDAIRNLSGEVSFQAVSGSDQLIWLSSGVFSHSADMALGGHNQIASVASGSWEQVLSFSADKVVPTAAENRPRNVAMHYIIKY